MWPFTSPKARRRSCAYRPRLEALEDRCLLNAGALDPTFGGGTGEVSLPWSTSNIAQSVAIQPRDGKIVSVGSVVAKGGTNEMSIVRLNANGSLDTSFNNTGSVDLKVGVSAGANVVALQPDGKILVGGSTNPTSKSDAEYAIARYNSNGTLDSTFANRGIFTWNPGPNQDWVQAMAVLGDGTIAVLGSGNNLLQGATVFKLNAAGTRLSSFGGGATALNQLYGTNLTGFAVAPNGDLIVSGTGGNTNWNGVGLIYAVNASTGALDPSFGSGQGWIAVSAPAGGYTQFNAVTIQGNDIVAAGDNQIQHQGEFGLLARFSLTGALDTSFANGGYFTTTSAGSSFTNVALELDGSIVAEMPGAAVQGLTGYLTVAHFTENGQLDTAFGGAGTGFSVISGAIGYGLAVGADGSILASGYSGPNVVGQRMAFFARLTPPEAMIGSFTANPNPVSSGSNVTLTASNITNSSTITQVAFYLDSNGDGKLEPGTDTLLGYATQTSPGVWTFTYTVNQTSGDSTLFAQAQDSDGVLGDAFALPLQVL